MRTVLLFLGLLALLAAGARAHELEVELDSVPATSQHASPISAAVFGADGSISDPVANPLLPDQPSAAVAPKAAPQKYRKAVDFLGSRTGVPMNPTRHLQRVLAEDKKYVTSILRAPIDIGDPAACTHKDLERDKLELKKIALRIFHRRVALKQQQHWIDRATEGLKHLDDEIATSTETARNLAEQLDALQQQKIDITQHVRRDMLLKELDRTSSNLMRLKNRRMDQEINLQAKHNKFAMQNHGHNLVLAKLHKMRTEGQLGLGYLEDPKPYRFQQVESEQQENSQAEAQAEQETEQQQETEQAAEQDTETQAEVEHATAVEQAAEQTTEETAQ
jgi:hypothetical protein